MDSIVESIFARLFVIDIIRYQLVCKRWCGLIRSQTFRSAFREVHDHSPWFLMSTEDNTINSVYDTGSGTWIQRELPIPKGTVYITTSSYLMCFVTRQGTINAGNPFTGTVDPLHGCVIDNNHEATAILAENGMFFQVFVVLRNVHGLAVKIYSSEAKAWREIQFSVQKLVEDTMDVDTEVYEWPSHMESGGLTTVNSEGNVMVYYLMRDCKLVKCDVSRCIAYEYPSIDIPEYEPLSYALVECGGRIFVVSLTDDFYDDDESENSDDEGEYFGAVYENDIELKVLKSGAGTDFFRMVLQLHEFKDDVEQWAIVSEKRVVLTGGYSSVIPDISCSGKGNYVMVCFHSEDYVLHDRVVKYNILEDDWEKLPLCIDSTTGEARKFVSAFSIVPDIAFLV